MEPLVKKGISTVSSTLALNYFEAPTVKSEMENTSINSDRRLTNLRDPSETDRTTMIQDTVEKAVSMESRHTVECLLEQVRQLSSLEKLLLYLKLPNGRSSTDPLRQNLNPLGSRLEIHHTITWIKTHLQEDPEVSLPKQDVYEQYLDFCQDNSVKPLSTADFGKVMKQVYPNVRPRRLGTRGHSRYCYAGLRKRMRLAPPGLPDLGPSEKTTLEDTNGGKPGSPERTLLAAVSVLIREWAGKTLGLRFSNLQELACHLVQSMSVNVQSTAALTVLSALNPPAPKSAGPSRPTSSTASLVSDSRPMSSCSAGPTRPASETPRSSIEKDHKRKCQEDVERLRLKSCDMKIRGKRTKHRSSSSPLEANISGGRRSSLNKANPLLTNQSSDSAVGSQSFSGVPYSSTKNGQADVQNNNTLLSNGDTLDACMDPVNAMISDTLAPRLSETPAVSADTSAESYIPSQRSDVGPDGKLPIPRLPKQTSKQILPNYMNMAYPSCLPSHQQQFHQSGAQKQKYKPIKPKPVIDECGAIKNEVNPSKQPPLSEQNGIMTSMGSSRKSGSDAIIGCLEKDALDDYLHGGSNSQEQEEELMQYFPQQSQQNPNQSMQVDIPSHSFDKISQLRLLLERSMNQDVANKASQYQNGLSAAASLSLLSQRSQQKQGLILPSLLAGQQNSSRRVSFEVPGEPDSASNSVPPSPNTKQRFGFTPISPRPFSPIKPSSANASPFVSPRNTPIPRRMSTQPSATFMQSTTPSVYSGKPALKSNIPRSMIRSTSVNSDAIVNSLSPFQSMNQQTYTAQTKLLDANQVNMDVKPDINALQDFGNAREAQPTMYASGWNPTPHSFTSALPPLQLPRSHYQVSMSAPQSPVVHGSKGMRKNTFNFRRESRAHSFDMESSNLLLPSVEFKNQNEFLSQHCVSQVHNVPDKYSQEVSDLFPEDDAMMPQLSSMPSLSSFRSQSVPLRRMVNSEAVSPMSATALPSPLYGPPPTQHGFFNFNSFTPASSVAPTPVPSEIADFGVDADGMHASAGSLQDIEIMRDDLNNSHQDGIPTESLNPDILNEMFSMFDEGKSSVHQTSQDFPQTPEQYTPDTDTTLRGDPLFSSFRLQAVGSECDSCHEEQLPLNNNTPTVQNSTDPILNDLGSMANPTTTQPGVDTLLEETPSSFMTEDLECEISQLTREVGNTST